MSVWSTHVITPLIACVLPSVMFMVFCFQKVNMSMLCLVNTLLGGGFDYYKMLSE